MSSEIRIAKLFNTLLVFVAMLEDCLSDGYFFWTNHDVAGRRPTLVKSTNPDGGYCGIMECLVGLELGTVIPVNFVKESLPEKRLEEIRQHPEVIHRNIVYSFEHVTFDDQRFSEHLQLFGCSNSSIIGALTRRGDCFVKAGIISAYCRTAGMPTRIIGFKEYPREAWESICAEHPTYHFTEPRISDVELDLRVASDPEARQSLQGFDSLANIPEGVIRELLSKPRTATLNPQQPPLLAHCWVEVMRNGKTERYNPNKEDFGFHKLLYDRGIAHAKVFPELYVAKDFRTRWKDLSFQRA